MSASLDPLRATVARRPLFSVSLIALYMTTGVLGLWGGFAPAGTTLLWLPSGIALGALLIFGYGIWPAVLASAAAVFAITGA